MIADALAWTVTMVAGLPTAMLAAECWAGTAPTPHRRDGPGTLPAHGVPTPAPAMIIVMPAHDEASGIEGSVRAAMAQLRAGDELLVVADNCSDDTAVMARAQGATVIERDEPHLRGKGHALDFARTFIARRGTDAGVVIVLDADCRAEPGSLVALTMAASVHHAAVQGVFLLSPPMDARPVVRVSSFAFLVKNLVRQQGLDRLSGSALLHGSGMAFPLDLFLGMNRAGGSLVEDLEMGLDLLLAGRSVVMEPGTRIWSATSSVEGTAGQRRRWEHGMMQTAWRYVPRLLGRSVRNPGLALVALDLMVPPTVLLAICSAIALVLVGVVHGVHAPFLLLLGLQLAAFLGLARAWRRHGRDLLPFSVLRELPGYMLWKLPLIAQFVSRRERNWNRTERTP